VGRWPVQVGVPDERGEVVLGGGDVAEGQQVAVADHGRELVEVDHHRDRFPTEQVDGCAERHRGCAGSGRGLEVGVGDVGQLDRLGDHSGRVQR
jgi:hypothetical protein